MEISDLIRHAAVNLTQFYQNVIIDVDERKILNNWHLQPNTNICLLNESRQLCLFDTILRCYAIGNPSIRPYV